MKNKGYCKRPREHSLNSRGIKTKTQLFESEGKQKITIDKFKIQKLKRRLGKQFYPIFDVQSSAAKFKELEFKQYTEDRRIYGDSGNMTYDDISNELTYIAKHTKYKYAGWAIISKYGRQYVRIYVKSR